MKRFIKYRDAREYAQRLALADNLDVADFAKDFLDALDAYEDSDIGEIERKIDEYGKDAPDDVVTCIEKIDWLGAGSDTLVEIEEMIAKKCPEYADLETPAVIEDMITRLRPKQEYDL